MFYLFHHMPKCGGTSFNAFLRSIFRVTTDYVGAPVAQEPERFETFKAKPLDLKVLNSRDCLSGHYNLHGIHLDERYPELESLEHRKFSILRDPFEAADSGVRFGMKRGWLPSELAGDAYREKIYNRANYFARTLRITEVGQIDDLFNRYWFIAPLDRVDHAMRILKNQTGKEGIVLPTLNTTPKSEEIASSQTMQDFRELSYLDYAIYEKARLHFEGFAARILRQE
jgi:hypothetical protein